jgi:hypothetical protein
MKTKFINPSVDEKLLEIKKTNQETLIVYQKVKKNMKLIEIINRKGTFRSFASSKKKAINSVVEVYNKRVA